MSLIINTNKKIVFIVLLIVTFSLLSISNIFQKVTQQEQFTRSDIKQAAGLLLPSVDSVPVGFIGDHQSYGFGSNDGCFDSSHWKTAKYETRFYCFRYFNPATVNEYHSNTSKETYSLNDAETIKFDAVYKKGDAPFNDTNFIVESFLKYLDSQYTQYTVESFRYNNVEGRIVSFSVDRLYGESVHRGTKLKVKKLFWKDGENYLTIRWSSPTFIPDSEKLMNILMTMRRSNGTALEGTNEYLSKPNLIKN